MNNKIKINDDYSKNLSDSFGKLKGRVKIYEMDNNNNRTLLSESKNLILYGGRSWLIQRAFNQSTRSPLPGEKYTSDRDKYISWFGVGHDGCMQSELLNPIYPMLKDRYLNYLSGSLPSLIEDSSLDGFETMSENVLSKPTSAYCGRLLRVSTEIGSSSNYNTEFLPDAENDDELLIAKISVTLNNNQANFDNSIEEYSDINECGLFISNTDDSAQNSIFDDNSITMFARYTFSTIRKYKERSLVFEWYIYF